MLETFVECGTYRMKETGNGGPYVTRNFIICIKSFSIVAILKSRWLRYIGRIVGWEENHTKFWEANLLENDYVEGRETGGRKRI